MARYFFDLHECGTIVADEDGVERANRDGLADEALRASRSIMSSEIVEGRLCLSCHIEVRDEAGEVVLTLPFRDAVTVTGLEASETIR